MNTAQAETKTPTVSELNELAEQIKELRDREAQASRVKNEITAQLEVAERTMLQLLESSGLKSYRAPAGLVGISYRTSVKTPKTPEQKNALFEYLRSVGRFDDMVGVNSQTLNSFYKEQLELARERGDDDFEIPGVTEITINPNLSFRRS